MARKLTDRDRHKLKEYRLAHPQLYREASRKWRSKPENYEKAKTYSREYWHKLPIEVRQLKQREANLGRFGVNIEWYDAKLTEQGGVCAICGRPPKTLRLAVDHDHNKGQKHVRGLLCSACNFSLHADRGADWYERATSYLRHYAG